MSDSEKAISKYLKDVKHLLPYTCKTRKMLLTELRESIEELNTAKDTLTYETLVAEIGSPEEVAHSFEDRESIAAFRKRSRRYSKAKVILACCAALLLIIRITQIFMFTQNYKENYRYEKKHFFYVFISLYALRDEPAGFCR